MYSAQLLGRSAPLWTTWSHMEKPVVAPEVIWARRAMRPRALEYFISQRCTDTKTWFLGRSHVAIVPSAGQLKLGLPS